MNGMVRLIEEQLDANQLDVLRRSIESGSANLYQAAFKELMKGPRAIVDRVVRAAVLSARKDAMEPKVQLARNTGTLESCKALEDDEDNWNLSGGVLALGRILADFGGLAVTTNFDPLIEVSVRTAGAECNSRILALDGSLSDSRFAGAKVVHLHGYWYGSDSLHTDIQLAAERPKLAISLQNLIGKGVLVVAGYGGWDDVFTRALRAVLSDDQSSYEILWSFYDDTEDKIQKRYGKLLTLFRGEQARSRITPYKGVNVHDFFPKLGASIAPLAPPRQRRTREAPWHAKPLTEARSGDRHSFPLDAGTVFGLERGSYILVVAGFADDGICEAILNSSERLSSLARRAGIALPDRRWEVIQVQPSVDLESLVRRGRDGAVFLEYDLESGARFSPDLIGGLFRRVDPSLQIVAVVHVTARTSQAAMDECESFSAGIRALNLGVVVYEMNAAFRPLAPAIADRERGFFDELPNEAVPRGSHIETWLLASRSRARQEDIARFGPVLRAARLVGITSNATSKPLSSPDEVASDLQALAATVGADLHANFLEFVDAFLPERTSALIQAMAGLESGSARRAALLYATRSDELMDAWVSGADLDPAKFGREIAWVPEPSGEEFTEDLTLALLRHRSRNVRLPHAEEMLRLLQEISPSDVISLCQKYGQSYFPATEVEHLSGKQCLLLLRAGATLELTAEMLNRIDAPDLWMVARARPLSDGLLSELLSLGPEARAVLGLCTMGEWQEIARDKQVEAKILECRNDTRPGFRTFSK